MCNKHIHADLMLEYAKDAQETDNPWERWEYRTPNGIGWNPARENLQWYKDFQYRRKRKTHFVNGKEVAAPLDKVEVGMAVWSFRIVTSAYDKIIDHVIHRPSNWEYEIERGLLFATKEDAQENFDAHFPPRNLKA